MTQQEQWLQEPVNGNNGAQQQQQQQAAAAVGKASEQQQQPQLRQLRQQEGQWVSQPLTTTTVGVAPASQQDAAILKQMLQPLKKPYRRTESAAATAVALPQLESHLAKQQQASYSQQQAQQQQQAQPQQQSQPQQQQQQQQLFRQWQQSQRPSTSSNAKPTALAAAQERSVQREGQQQEGLMRHLEEQQTQLLQQEVKQEQQAEAVSNPPPPARGASRRLLFNQPPVGPVFGLLSAAVAALPFSHQLHAAERFVLPGAMSLSSPERSTPAVERGAREESAPGMSHELSAPIVASATSLLSVTESARPPTLAANAARASKFNHVRLQRQSARPSRFDYLHRLTTSSAAKKVNAAAPVRLLASRPSGQVRGEFDLASEEARVKAELARADQELQAGAQAMATAEASLKA